MFCGEREGRKGSGYCYSWKYRGEDCHEIKLKSYNPMSRFCGVLSYFVSILTAIKINQNVKANVLYDQMGILINLPKWMVCDVNVGTS